MSNDRGYTSAEWQRAFDSAAAEAARITQNRRSLPTCFYPGCQGHLGKFDGCVEEAVWAAILSDGSGNDSAGDSDYGTATLIVFAETEAVDIGISVTVPAGAYVAFEESNGFVTVCHYETEAEARAVFDGFSADYYADDDCDSCPTDI